MSQPELEPKPVKLNIVFEDASNLPILHVNALNLRISLDEFYFTLGTVQPPDQTEQEDIANAGYAMAHPIFRFAISRSTMEQFLSVMARLYDQQTTLNQRLSHTDEEISKEGVNGNE